MIGSACSVHHVLCIAFKCTSFGVNDLLSAMTANCCRGCPFSMRWRKALAALAEVGMHLLRWLVQDAMEMPYALLYPLQPEVMRALSRAVDDRKRDVRMAAVRCRRAWTAPQL